MSREDFVAIASRLFAVFLMVVTVRAVAGSYPVASSYGSGSEFLLRISVFAIPSLAVSALLWFFPLSVARKLLPVMREPRPAISVASDHALELALTVLGFWVLATAISDGLYWIVMLAYANSSQMPGFELEPDQKANVIATGVELVIGFVLLFGSRGLAALAYRLRYARST